MTQIEARQVVLAEGRSVTFQIGTFAQEDAYFVLGIRKCGSSIMHSMMHDLARLNRHPFVDVGGMFFAANVPEQDWRHDARVLAMLAPGNVYGGFRVYSARASSTASRERFCWFVIRAMRWSANTSPSPTRTACPRRKPGRAGREKNL
jgi:hypothetical protein